MKSQLKIQAGAGAERLAVEELYRAFARLETDGWTAETVAISSRKRNGRLMSLPIPSFHTGKTGRAVWIISGIHGEEPAGPNAVAVGIDIIRQLGDLVPVVLLPLCNPLGYACGWRYLNRANWQEGATVMSVGDAEHVLPDAQAPSQPRCNAPSSAEAAALTGHVLRLSKTYPPAFTFDFHEDNLLSEGYVYSQGRRGSSDSIAQDIVQTLHAQGIPMQSSGRTRFGEDIADGVVGPQNDGSIDELLASGDVIVDGRRMPGPAAETVIVIETPAGMRLDARRDAHLAVLERLASFAASLRP
jgi:hypothetical protein